jgi:hypothetical protein
VVKSSAQTSSDGNVRPLLYSVASTWSMVVPASRSEPSVFFGLTTPVKKQGSASAWPPWRCGPVCRLVTTFRYSRYGSNGLRMAGRSKPVPGVDGVHALMIMPLGE